MTAYSLFKIRMACQALKQGQLIAYPTEAVYGLGCDPYNQYALQQLLTLKQRPIDKGLILVAAHIAQLLPFIVLSPAILKRILPTWPGAITWVVPAKKWVPKHLKGQHDTLAVRVSAHPSIQGLCNAYQGAIVSTSANISQHAPAKSALQVRQQLRQKNLFILNGKSAQQSRPTAIYDATTGLCLRKA